MLERSHQAPYELIQSQLEKLIVDARTALVLNRRKWILDNILNPKVDINLMQHVAHARRPGIRNHDEAQVGGRLVKVQLVLARAVADEGVVVAAELADHVAEGEDGAEDELCVVGAGGQDGGRGAGDLGGHPGFDVDAFSVAVEDVEGVDDHGGQSGGW